MPSFTSQEEIARVYSNIGVDLRLDDLSDADADDMMDEIVAAATATIAAYTLKWYDSDKLVNSDWVRRRATIIGCYYLSSRRANGTQFYQEYQRILQELELFLKPQPPIIPNNDGYPVPVRSSQIPTVSAYIVDDRLRRRKLRVNKDYSTKQYPGQYGYYQYPGSDYP